MIPTPTSIWHWAGIFIAAAVIVANPTETAHLLTETFHTIGEFSGALLTNNQPQ